MLIVQIYVCYITELLTIIIAANKYKGGGK